MMDRRANENQPPGEGAAVSIQNVSVEFVSGERKGKKVSRVLDDFSLECQPGEFVVLVGRSGCGKTTVLNLLSGLVKPTEGRVEVLGRSPNEARPDMGYMFARDALLPWRRAQANVEFGLELRSVPRAERRRRASEMLMNVGLADSAAKFPWQLSQGMRQRVALARTWVLKPELILMDEPFAALDAQTKVHMRSQFLRMWEAGRPGIVFVTHDLTEALLLGDRVLLLKDGKIDVDINVPFAHPRETEELIYTEEFRELERDLWRHLY